MSKCKPTDELNHLVKKSSSSQDYIFYQGVKKTEKITKIAPTKIEKPLKYKFFIDCDNQYFPL